MTQQILIALVGIVGSAVAAYFGFWLGLRRFRHEHMWEEKLRIYTALFDALNDLCEENDQLWKAEVSGRQLPKARQDALSEAALKAWPEVSKQARIGAFIFSDKAAAALATLMKEVEKAGSEDSYFEHIDKTGGALNRAVTVLRKAARADLGT